MTHRPEVSSESLSFSIYQHLNQLAFPFHLLLHLIQHGHPDSARLSNLAIHRTLGHREIECLCFNAHERGHQSEFLLFLTPIQELLLSKISELLPTLLHPTPPIWCHLLPDYLRYSNELIHPHGKVNRPNCVDVRRIYCDLFAKKFLLYLDPPQTMDVQNLWCCPSTHSRPTNSLPRKLD